MLSTITRTLCLSACLILASVSLSAADHHEADPHASPAAGHDSDHHEAAPNHAPAAHTNPAAHDASHDQAKHSSPTHTDHADDHAPKPTTSRNPWINPPTAPASHDDHSSTTTHGPAATHAPVAPAQASPAADHNASTGAHTASEAHSETTAQGLNGRQALDRLLAGNKRFLANLTSRSHQGTERRDEVAAHQNPVAVIVCCSDSRVSPELTFDQGIGDVFVVRTAGNIVDAIALGSIEYACEHLHVPLVLVIGHERCGAVTAAVGKGKVAGQVKSVVDMIQQNIAANQPVDGGTVDEAVMHNARAVAHQISSCPPILEGLVRSENLLVVAARYDLDSGEIVILP